MHSSPRKKTMRTMFEADRHSASAIASISVRSSGDRRSGKDPPATLFLGVRARCVFCTCVIVVYCDLLSVREKHCGMKFRTSQEI